MGLYGYYTFPATPLLLWRKIQKKKSHIGSFSSHRCYCDARRFSVCLFAARPRYGRRLTGKSQKCDTPHEEAAGEGRS